MARPEGSRNALIRVTYDTIAEMAGGITGNTARRYAQRGQFDPRDLDSLLTWVNSRRKRQGEPLIGMPTDNAPQADSNDRPDDPWSRFLAGLPVYVPTLGQHLSIYDIP
ncbi:hypothetical protein ACFL5Q_00050 [Planctomycetota bacterium]